MADRDIDTEICEYVVGLLDGDADHKWDLPDLPPLDEVVDEAALTVPEGVVV